MAGQDIRPPYPGLRSYRSDESDLFFGREGCVDDMLDRLAETRFLSVLGTSGSGKSSLVRTGLLDALELGFLAGRSTDWRVADLHPGGRPIHNLARTLLELEGSEAGEIELSLMQAFIARGPRSVIQWCDDQGLSEDQNLLLLVDQFEELFRYKDYAGREEAEAFVALLLESARSDRRIHVVITMRSEFLGACAMMPGLAEQINSGLYLTRRMTRAECREAIEGPAKVLGFDVEPRLVSEILNDLASFAPWERESALTSLEQLSRRADQLPLMQHVLNRLYERARREHEKVVLTYADYRSIGGLRGAIDAHARDIMETLAPDTRALAEPVFRALISGTTISNAVRDPKRYSDLVVLAGGNDAALREILDAFRANGCNFLRPEPEIPLEHDTIVDLGHESLIRQWSDIGTWLDREARDGATWARIVTAQEANAAGEGDLIDGLDLANATSWWDTAQPSEAWAARRQGDFQAVKAFLEESVRADQAREAARAAEEQRRVRRLRARAAAYLLLAAVSVGAAIYGWNASNIAQQALSETQAAQATTKEALEQAEDARATAVDALAQAEVAQRETETALVRANDANALTVSASETFLIDMIDRLRNSFGIRPDEIDQMLLDGTRFLDELDAQMPGNDGVRQARSNLLIEKAWVSYTRGAYGPMAVHLDEAAALLPASGLFTSKDVISAVQIERLRSARHRFLDQGEAALQHATRIRGMIDKHADVLTNHDSDLAETIALFSLANAQSTNGAHEDGIASIRACYAVRSPGHAESDAVTAMQALCAGTMVSLYLSVGDGIAPEDVIAEAEQFIQALSENQRDLEQWKNWVFHQESVAQSRMNANDTVGATRTYDNLINLLNQLVAAAPYDRDILAQRALAREQRGLLHRRAGEREASSSMFLAAIQDLEAMGRVIQDDPAFAEQYRRMLSTAQSSLIGTKDWFKDPRLAEQITGLASSWYRQAIHMEKAGFDTCNACAFTPIAYMAEVYEARFANGEEQFGERLLSLFDRARARYEALDLETASELQLIQARRTLYWTMTDLPSSSKHARVISDAAVAISLFERSLERLDYMLRTFPEAHEAKFHSANAHHSLAVLYHDVGRPLDAERALLRGVDLQGFSALKLLLEWADTGSGPIERDPARAAEISAMLAARDWSPQRIDVQVDERWTEDRTLSVQNLWLRDAPFGGDSAVERAILEAEHMKGWDISDESIERLRAWEAQANEKEITFVRHYSIEVVNSGNDDPKTAEDIELRLRRHAENNEVWPAAVVIARADNVSATRDALREALDNLLENQSETGYVSLLNFVIDAGDELIRRNYARYALPIFDAAISRAGIFDVDRQVQLYDRRARVYKALGKPEDELRDLLYVLALRPNDYRTLNSVGYDLTENSATLPLAIELLERAVAVEPERSGQSHYAMDSLGWAYVLDGRVKKGLALIKDAFVRGDDDQAEIMYHVGEAHLRLGDEDKALAAFMLAREYRGIDTVKNDIEARLNRMGHFPNLTRVEIDAIEQAQQAAASQRPDAASIAVDSAGVAVEGYDAVLMLTEDRLEPGSALHWSLYRGALWFFASAQSRAQFNADPAKYAPAFDGYCAYCLGSSQKKLVGYPKYRTINGDRLYLHSSQGVATRWTNEFETRLARSNAAWSRLRTSSGVTAGQSHVSALLNAFAAGASVQRDAPHATFASAKEVDAARGAVAAIGRLNQPTLARVSTDRNGIAIGGFDPVAYHTAGAAQRGSLEHWLIWQDAVWLFQTAEHRELFQAAPHAYAPEFGGYCAYCMAGGSKTHGNPRHFTLDNGILHLHNTVDNRARWRRNSAEMSINAAEKWEEVKDAVPEASGRASRFVALMDAVHRGADITPVEW